MGNARERLTGFSRKLGSADLADRFCQRATSFERRRGERKHRDGDKPQANKSRVRDYFRAESRVRDDFVQFLISRKNACQSRL